MADMRREREEREEKGWEEGGRIALYGAGMVAVSVYRAIRTLYPDWGIVCFLVSEKRGNPRAIDGIPVVPLEEFHQGDVKILVAVPENHHPAIAAELEKRNLRNYFLVGSRREAALMERYYGAVKQFPSLHAYPWREEKEPLEERGISRNVYLAEFYKDVPLKNPYPCPEWLHPLQAGAAIGEGPAAGAKDNTGDHISEKNGNYSELTALYWIWKNKGYEGTERDYLGLFHYRRVLDVAEEDWERAVQNEIDVLLPYPTVHYPSIAGHHRRYVKDGDWEAMVSALRELAPEYAQSLPGIFSLPYFYNHNLVIARRRIFCGFCGWLFPILQRTEERSVPRGWERADRYLGYLGESLTTLYFMYHKNDFKIAHTGRIMLT